MTTSEQRLITDQTAGLLTVRDLGGVFTLQGRDDTAGEAIVGRLVSVRHFHRDEGDDIRTMTEGQLRALGYDVDFEFGFTDPD